MASPSGTLPLEELHLSSGRLFANRFDMARHLFPKNSAIAEIGVALGDFSEFLIRETLAASFDAFDLFLMHEAPIHWGKTSAELFGGLTQRQFFERRIAPLIGVLNIHEGYSKDTLATCSTMFDGVYVDGAHDYNAVLLDGRHSHRLLKPGGIAIFNDYTHYDQFLQVPYGVIQAVNELVREGLFTVIGFAFEKNGFHDIAVRKSPS